MRRTIVTVVALLCSMGMVGATHPVLVAAAGICPSKESGLRDAIAISLTPVILNCSSDTTIHFDGNDGGIGTLTINHDVTIAATGSPGTITFDGGTEAMPSSSST
jgi:hypothetical protein